MDDEDYKLIREINETLKAVLKELQSINERMKSLEGCVSRDDTSRHRGPSFVTRPPRFY